MCGTNYIFSWYWGHDAVKNHNVHSSYNNNKCQAIVTNVNTQFFLLGFHQLSHILVIRNPNIIKYTKIFLLHSTKEYNIGIHYYNIELRIENLIFVQWFQLCKCSFSFFLSYPYQSSSRHLHTCQHWPESYHENQVWKSWYWPSNSRDSIFFSG